MPLPKVVALAMTLKASKQPAWFDYVSFARIIERTRTTPDSWPYMQAINPLQDPATPFKIMVYLNKKGGIEPAPHIDVGVRVLHARPNNSRQHSLHHVALSDTSTRLFLQECMERSN